ncbi:hypothetical protein [Microbispora hainanensis]|jgi:hypothetical protein|uniref:Sel1 repeat family protein n=1 Tax=Microbispora hainanensis TaxID=568844 RepID=A0ABZ1SQQ8_9ACTN|nr:hypothetical protein [Microbispora hainanensis]
MTISKRFRNLWISLLAAEAMTEEARVAACRAFLAQLNTLHEQAGSPTMSELEKLSGGTGNNGHQPRLLTRSTTHDILRGKRKKVPSWPWVASFVTACHAAAEQTGLPTETMGTLTDWHARWRAARGDQPAVALDSEASEEPLAEPSRDPMPPVPSSPTPAPDDDPLLPAEDAGQPDEHAQRMLQVYGRTGVRLMKDCPFDVKVGVSLAVIALLRGHAHEGVQRLREAAQAGHRDALELLSHPRRQQMAADYAYRCGLGYQRADRTEVAMFFYRMAADPGGHPEAAYQLALIHRDKGEGWSAAYWFRIAAAKGHHLATAAFDGISEELSHAHPGESWMLPTDMVDSSQPPPPSLTGDPPAPLI